LSIIGLYATVFNLRERPFTLLPDPDFLYWTKLHSRAYTVLEYGILSRAPITVITGEVGVGKTTLLQHLLKTMGQTATIGLISNAQGGRGELLRWALNSFGVVHDRTLDYVGLFQELQTFLLKEYAAGRHAVIVIDEAQNLSFEALEELRMLTNINSNKDELLQLILIGQPELRRMVERPELRQFAQRVTASFHLTGMDQEGTAEYIAHRMRHAGGTGEEFTGAAVALIHETSLGIPRMINKICELCLVYAATEGAPVVSHEVVREVLADNLFIQTREERGKPPIPRQSRIRFIAN
jgi:general secretion pathway protein A